MHQMLIITSHKREAGNLVNLCVFVCVFVGHYSTMWSWQVFLFLSVDRFSYHNSITNLQHTFMKLSRCVVEMKARFEDGCSLTHEHSVLM